MALLSIGEILDLGNNVNMSAYIPYSALDYNPTGAISGISGSAIAGGVESSVVSSIVSSMVSGKADQSALDNCCSSMSSVVSSIQNDVSSISSFVSGMTGDYLEKSASSMFAPSGDYAYNSAISSKLDASASSEFYPTSNPSGFITGVDLDGYATTAYVDSSVSSKMDKSESSSFYPMTGNPSGFLTSVDLSNYATTAYVDSSVSGKMDATASGYLQPSGDYAYNSSLADYLPASASGDFITSTAGLAPSGDYAYNSAVSGKLDASASSQFALSGDYAYNSSLSSYLYASASSNFQPSGNYQTAGDYAYNSAVSSKLDASASSSFYPTSNPSGFITGVDLDGYATTAYVDSSVSGKMDKSESSSFYPMTGNPSGFLTSVDLSDYATTAYVDSSVSGKLDTSAQVVTSILKFVHYDQSSVCQINEMPIRAASAEMGTDGRYISSLASKSSLSSYYPTSNPSGFITDSTLANYATTAYVDSSVSGKMDKTESSSFYPMYSNPSGYLTAVDINECVLSAGSGIDFRVNGQGVYIDVNFYNAFTSLSAWATAQGWTGV